MRAHEINSFRSWFANSKLPLFNILLLIYYWVKKFKLINVKEKLQYAEHSVIDWYKFYREVYLEVVLAERGQIEGPGRIIKINESKFGKRKYYHR